MTLDALPNEQSIDIEYGDFISSLQNNAESDPKGDEPVEELNDDDDYSDFSNDDEGDNTFTSQLSPLQNLSLQQVCDPCHESILTHSDCSNLNTLFASLSDALGYDDQTTSMMMVSSALNLQEPIEEMASSESLTPPLDTSTSASSSEDCNDTCRQKIAPKDDDKENHDGAITECTSDMNDGLKLLDKVQKVLQCPTCTASHLDVPFDEEEVVMHVPTDPKPVEASKTTTAMDSAKRQMDRETTSEIIVADSTNHRRTHLSFSPCIDQQQLPNNNDSPMKNRKEYYVETSFLSTVFGDESSLSDWDEGSIYDDQSPVQENNKKRKSRKWYCYLIGNSLLVIVIFAMSTLIGVSLLDDDSANSEVQGAVVATPSFVPSNAPTFSRPTVAASFIPTHSQKPTNLPSEPPTWSMVPSTLPSILPSSFPTSNPTYGEYETTFYAIGDVPYNNLEKIQLRDRMMHLMPRQDGGEFLIHVGDIRSGQDKNALCRLEEYEEVRDILMQSDIPVFIIPGDNEWIDCPNPIEGRYFWRQTFGNFDKNWNHPFQVVRHPDQPENFYFVHKRTLYFGLNMVSGRILNLESHSMQLEDHAEFVKSMIDQQVVAGDVAPVVLFGHAFPRDIHDAFFVPLKKYIQRKLSKKVPILYLNGDLHKFDFEQNYLGLSNFQRLQVDFGTVNPPLKVTVSSSSRPGWNATDTFSHDRMLSDRLY